MNDIRLNSHTIARRCACRGWIIGEESSVAASGEKVAVHQEAEPHRSWDREAWITANTTTQQVRTVIRRVDREAA